MMESFLNPKDFELENKDRSIENLSRWRSAVSLVKNPRRRFRHVADLVKRRQAAENQKKIQVSSRFILAILFLLQSLFFCLCISLISKA
jgi:Ca2+-transporting ATPase